MRGAAHAELAELGGAELAAGLARTDLEKLTGIEPTVELANA